MPERRTVPPDFLSRLVLVAGGVEAVAEALGTPALCVRMAIDGEIAVTELAFVRILAALRRGPASLRVVPHPLAVRAPATPPADPAAPGGNASAEGGVSGTGEERGAGGPPPSPEALVEAAGGLDAVAGRIGVTARVIQEILESGRPLPEWFLDELRAPRAG